MKRITAFFLFGVLIISNSCQLPPSPNEPFYCKINGKAFRPGKDTSPFGGIGVSPLRYSKEFDLGWYYIIASNSPREVSLSIKLNPNEVIHEGEYILGNDLKQSTGNFYENANQSNAIRLVSSTGKLTITRLKNSRLSGAFEFKTKNKAGTEFLITNGQVSL
jgi:hypothetical protein